LIRQHSPAIEACLSITMIRSVRDGGTDRD
jgi:hypothetical protein